MGEHVVECDGEVLVGIVVIGYREVAVIVRYLWWRNTTTSN